MTLPYDVIIVNGDSYSAPVPTNHKVYADYLESKLGIPVINIAGIGSNNDRIARSTVEQVLEILDKFANPLVIIGWSFVRRQEVWYYGNNPNVLSRAYDQLKFVTLDWLINNSEATLEQKCLVNEDLFVHKQLTDFYTQVYLTTQFLKNNKCSYLFFSAGKNEDMPINSFPLIERLHQVQAVTADPNIINLHTFYIKDWSSTHDPKCNKETGHMSENGHELFAEFLIEKLT